MLGGLINPTRALLVAAALLATVTCGISAARAGAAPLPTTSPLYNAAAPIVDENPEVSAEYSGSMTEVFEYPQIESHLDHVHRTATLEWAEGVSGPVDQIEYTGIYGSSAIHWHVSKLSGEVKEDSTGVGGEAIDCSGSFSPRTSDGGEQGVSIPLDEPGEPAGGGNPATNPDYSVRPPLGLPTTLLSSSGSEVCSTNNWNSNGNSGWGGAATFGASEAMSILWGDTVAPTVYFPPAGTHSQELDYSYTCQPPDCGPETGGSGTRYGKVSVTVTSSITFSSPGLPSPTQSAPVTQHGTPAPPPAPGPPALDCTGSRAPSCLEKKGAQQDLRGQLRPLALECGVTVLGTGLVVAGLAAPETGAGSVLAAAGPTGAMILAGAGTACGLLVKRAYDDAKTIEDPPKGALRKLAKPARPKGPAGRLPKCRKYAVVVRAYCEKLRRAELRYLTVLRSGQAVSAALMLTVDRITGAYEAHDRSALALQSGHATALRTELSSGLARERAAAHALAALIQSQRLTIELSGPQEQAGIARAFSKLAHLGVTGAKAEALSGVSLSGVPTDFLAQLAS